MRRLLVILTTLAVLIPSAAFAYPHYSQAYTKRAIRAEAKRHHYGKENTNALVKLAYRESRWRSWSRSRGGCWGTFQLAKSMCGGHKWWNPTWNTRRAIRYIKHRYGTPKRALAHSRRYGWY